MATEKAGTRSRLVRTTHALMWEGSFNACGVDEICREADVRKGSFYHFFPSKTDLAIAALNEGWKHAADFVFEPVFALDLGGLERLEAIVRAVDAHQRSEFERGDTYLGCPFGGIGQEMAHQDPRVRDAVHTIFEYHVDYFERALQEARASGDIERGDLRSRAEALFAILEGALLLARVANDPDRFTEIAATIPLIARG